MKLQIIYFRIQKIACILDTLLYCARYATCPYQLIKVYAMDCSNGAVSHSLSVSQFSPHSNGVSYSAGNASVEISAGHQGPLLWTWINFNPHMDM